MYQYDSHVDEYILSIFSIMNKVVINIPVQVFCGNMSSFLLAKQIVES